MVAHVRSPRFSPTLFAACGLAVVAFALPACSQDAQTTASLDAQPSPLFTGSNAGFCADLLAANDHSAAAEAAKEAGDSAGVQSSAASMFAALQDALAVVPDNAPEDVRKALSKYSDTVERAIAGQDLGEQARDSVKETTAIIERYYTNKCRLA